MFHSIMGYIHFQAPRRPRQRSDARIQLNQRQICKIDGGSYSAVSVLATDRKVKPDHHSEHKIPINHSTKVQNPSKDFSSAHHLSRL